MIEETSRAGIVAPNTVTIRPMRASDIEHVARIERKSFPTNWSIQAYVTELSNPSALYRVALYDNTVVGYGGLWLIMDEAHITTLAVDPALRGKRIGERLLVEMLRQAMENGAERATLEVRETNDAARGLYAKYGFVPAAIRKAYYSDNQEDALIMWIHDMLAPAWRRRFAELRGSL